ncbi:MAG: (Fe-S)-binding protein [Candidatus Asgardarchaeia archaeon]
MLYDDIKKYENIVNRCIGCNFCIENSWLGPYHGCPVYDIKEFESYGPRGRNLIMSLLIAGDENLKLDKKLAERIFLCADCGFCEEFCMTGLPLEELRLALSNYILKNASELPKSVIQAKERLLKTGNIFGKSDKEKLSWLDDKSVVDKENAEIVYFVGCSTHYSQTQIAKAVVEILKKTNANFTILSSEKCCGYPLFAVGDIENGIKFIEDNIQQIKSVKAKTVLFNCPGCMKTFTRTYTLVTGKQFPFKAMHSTEYLNNYLKERRLKLRLDLSTTATYHDPCHLGRGLGIYAEPRELIKRIENLQLIEMPRSKEKSYCCGGALTTTNPRIKEEISLRRFEEMEKLGVSIFLQACPTCAMNLKRVAEKKNSKVKVMDVIELFNMLL